MVGILSDADEFRGIIAAPPARIRKFRREIIPAPYSLRIHRPFYIDGNAAGSAPCLLPSTSMIDGYTELPPGKVAAVVTYLEMRTPPPLSPSPTLSEFT